MGWHEDLMPIIFGGECKPQITYSKNTCAQLAVAFHSTLVILILYYLDNRTSTSDLLPNWLFIYGIEYTEFGFIVRVHYPYYDFEEASWKFGSVKFTEQFSRVFGKKEADQRLSALAFLFRMRSHGLLIKRKLSEWTRAPEVLVVLQHQAMLEREFNNVRFIFSYDIWLIRIL
jgi:hypothetical protein